jgi:hypothetical protein
VIALFIPLQALATITLSMTVEQRYNTSILYMLLILFGLALTRMQRPALVLAIYAVIAFAFALPRMQHLRDYQDYVYDLSQKQMGLWLNENTSENSRVYLEPLGYAGYYSSRYMIDDVGLVTPAIVPLKRERVDSFILAHYFQADYVVLHCDDALRAPAGFPYQMAVRFDPLGFADGDDWKDKGLQRNACYEIHEKRPGD